MPVTGLKAGASTGHTSTGLKVGASARHANHRTCQSRKCSEPHEYWAVLRHGWSRALAKPFL